MCLAAFAFFILLPDNAETSPGEDYLKSIVLLAASADEASKVCDCEITVIKEIKVSLTYPFKPRDTDDLTKMKAIGACGIVINSYTKALRNDRTYVQGLAFKSEQCETLRNWHSIFTGPLRNSL